MGKILAANDEDTKSKIISPIILNVKLNKLYFVNLLLFKKY